jgi:tetratricopeptide (TPR) repeat protein
VLEWANGLPAAAEGVVLELPGGKTENRTSDANGVVAFEYPAAVAGEYAVVLRPTGRQALPGSDDGGLAGMARFSVSADEFGLAFGVMPEVVLAGEAFEMKLRARRYDERGWAGAVKLTVARRGAVVPSRVLEGVPWISAPVREAKDEVVLDGEVVIGESGDAAQALALPQPGNYVLKLSGKDRQGHEIMVETMLRAVGGEEDAVLRVLGPAEPLVAGQVLKLRIQSGFAHPNALVTVHAQEFFSHQLVALKAGANELEIPVLAVHAPNFRVTVAAVDRRQVHVASRPFEVRSGLRLELAEDGNGYVVRTTDLAGRPVAAAVVAHAWASGGAGGLTAMPRVVVPTRATGLSLDSSVAFFHTGITVQKTADKVVLTDNNIKQLFAIQQTELSFNTSNTALVALNEGFAVGNGFLEVGDAVKRGVFVINPGLKAMKADALGIDVKIRTEGVPDIRWRDEAAVARAAGMVGAAGEAKAGAGMMTVLKTDAGGVARAELAAGGDGAVVVAYAVDGTSLMAADVLVIPSKAKLRVRAVVPDEVTPGQEFEMPVVVTNLSGETTASTMATVMTGGVVSLAMIPAIEPGRTAVVRAQATCPVPWADWAAIPIGVPGWGVVAGVGRSQRPVTVTLGGVEWRGVLRTRTLKVPVVVPVGGIFGQGEHVLTLPAGEGAVGVRIVKSADLASFPGASLDAGGELQDASEPQHPASALLHVLAARAGATDETVKRALDGRMALLAAELAVTESEGGWSWENIGISPGLLTTAFTWRALLEAKAAGTVVSDMMLKRTAAFVAGRYRGIGATDFERKATTLQSLAAAGQADFSVLNPLYRARETLTPVALSRLCAAFIHAGREEEAKEVLVQLLKTGTAGKTAAGEETLFWPGAKTVAGLNAPEEATAAALWCVARLNPGAPEARRIAMWLINAAASAPGGTTRCRGQVMQALAEYAKALPRAAAGDRVEVLSGGQAVEVMPGQLVPMPADGRLVIRVSGAAPAVVIAAVEREVAPDDPKTWEYPKIGGRLYLQDNFVTDGIRLGAAGSSPVTQAAYGQLVHVVVKVSNHPDPTWQSHGNFLQIDEEIPAGCLLVEGSLRHNADRVERSGNRLRLRYGPGTIQDISYDVIALMPGVWPVRASEIADPYDPARCRRGVAGSLTVLAPGVASPDAYQMNRAEHLELARLRFAQNKGAECLGHLDALAGGKLSQDEERDMARMRLWILADAADGDARAMIGAFELLSERHPRLVIPFDKLLKVGPAYRKLGEFERAATVFRAALDGAFLEDAGLAVVLEDNGDFAGSVAFQEVLWSRYPDSRDVMDSLSGLAQSLSTRAPEAEKLPVRRGQPKLEKVGLLGRSLGLLQRYATLYPEDEQADDVAFSMVNVHFALKDYPGMVAAATAGAERHAGGGFADSFKYMAALGYFWQGAFDKALAAAAPVANGEGKDRDYARYVTAQVHHAQGQPALAIEWYSKVKGVYEDAAEAIALFEEKRVTLPEVTVFKPGEPVKLTLDYRNIREGAVQLYKVDLMKLYLREKSLSSITRVNLAGIAPEAGESFALGDGKDFAVKQKVLTLPVKEEGAYLAIVRGDNLFTSGLVLVSALKLEVKENSSGTVRVTVTDAAGGKAVSDADVKALGSQSMVVQSGSTDPRGVFETGGIAGTATVIVKQGESRYAFHRGNTVIGGEFDPPQILQNFGGDAPARNDAGLEQRASGKPKVMSKGDYLKNIDDSNKALQKQQIDNWEGKRRSNAKGVEASEALKK